MKCSGENVILRGTIHVVSCFSLHFMLYRGNFDYFSDSVITQFSNTATGNNELAHEGFLKKAYPALL